MQTLKSQLEARLKIAEGVSINFVATREDDTQERVCFSDMYARDLRTIRGGLNNEHA